MIKSFRDTWLATFFVENHSTRQVPPDIEARLFRKLQLIDDATMDQDLRAPPSNHFEKLKGSLADSIRSASTSAIAWYFDGMAEPVKRRKSISMITAIDEVDPC